MILHQCVHLFKMAILCTELDRLKLTAAYLMLKLRSRPKQVQFSLETSSLRKDEVCQVSCVRCRFYFEMHDAMQQHLGQATLILGTTNILIDKNHKMMNVFRLSAISACFVVWLVLSCFFVAATSQMTPSSD